MSDEMGQVPQLHGVLVTFRRPEDLRRSLLTLKNQTRPLDTLLVVDNSPDREAKEVVVNSGAAVRVDYHATGRNLGPAGGIAAGMERCLEYADARDWICILDDDDPLPDDHLLTDRMHLAEASVGADLAGFADGGGMLDRRTGRLRPAEAGGEADYLGSGYCPLYRVAALRSVGVFNSELFFGFDDLDYGLRLEEAGWRLRVVNGPRTWGHPRRAPSLKVGPLDWRRYYSLRNIVYLLRTHGHTSAAIRVSLVNGLAKPIANLPLEPRLAFRHLRMNARAIRDAWLGRLGMTVRPDAARRVGKPDGAGSRPRSHEGKLL